jgi:hypothetical protein
MINTLKRIEFRPDGIFGAFTFEGDDKPFMSTLEHAYQDEFDGSYQPKIPAGTYTCTRGTHELHDGVPFETFEVTGVEGHSGILCCHVGNYNRDSDGCILGGSQTIVEGNCQMITNSKATFISYMARLAGINEFTLVVE